MSNKPFLLLDVDGPVNPFRLVTKKGHLPPKARENETPYTYEKHLMRPRGWTGRADLPVLVSPEMGSDLNALRMQFELVWATTWEEQANELLSPLLGLPTDLPVIKWDLTHPLFKSCTHSGSWKTPLVLDWLQEEDPTRPWVFIDDGLLKHDRTYAKDFYGEDRGDPQAVPRWMLQIHPLHGLRRNDITALSDWAAEHG